MRTVVPVLVASLLTACTADPAAVDDATLVLVDAADASLPVDQAAPPLFPDLAVEPIVAGQPFNLTVTNVPSAATVWFVIGTNGYGLGPCVPGRSICTDLRPPLGRLGPVVADATGTARLTVVAPSRVPWPTVLVQALVWKGQNEGVSTVVEVITNDFDGDGSPTSRDCDDNDPNRFPGNPVEIADGIDSDCDGDDVPADYFDGTYSSLDWILPSTIVSLCVPISGSVTIDHTAARELTGSLTCLDFLNGSTRSYSVRADIVGNQVDGTLRQGGIDVYDLHGTLSDVLGGPAFLETDVVDPTGAEPFAGYLDVSR
ncbi:MAG: putative metal-binding motif-containing protein [Alphaproteobacteria bacterium]|nr:putative metal-binding motif-containing protein [Alphaproteobacteria bacterium]